MTEARKRDCAGYGELKAVGLLGAGRVWNYLAFGSSGGFGRKKREARRKKFLTNNFSGESTRQAEATGASGERKLAESLELREIEGKGVRTAEAAQDASLQGEGLRVQKLQFDAALRVCLRTQNGGDQGIEERVFGGGDFGGFAERVAEARIVVTLEGRQQVAAHAVAEKARIEIGGVGAKWLVEGAEKRFDLAAGDGEQRADQARRRGRIAGRGFMY